MKWNFEVRNLGNFSILIWIIPLIAILNVPNFGGHLIIYIAYLDMFSLILLVYYLNHNMGQIFAQYKLRF